MTQNGSEIIFTISANRFLRNMVRAIVGTMVDIGLGKIKPEDLHKIIQQKHRNSAGVSAPAHGLYLVNVEYKFYKFHFQLEKADSFTSFHILLNSRCNLRI